MLDRRFRLLAQSTRSEVRILGEAEALLMGGSSASVRFTNSVTGKLGIQVSVERVDNPE